MSAATKDMDPADIAGEQTERPSGEAPFPLSAEEAERVASQFKPTWEVDSQEESAEDAEPEAAGDAPPAPSAQHVAIEEPEAPPPEEVSQAALPGAAPEAGLPHAAAAASDEAITDALEEDVLEEQGPVDIVADIPKRTKVHVKDEPSVVVPPIDPEQPRPAPAAVVSATVEGDIMAPVDRRGRNKKIVIGVVGVAALVFVVGGLKVWLTSEPHGAAETSASAQSEENLTVPESLPVAKETPSATATTLPTANETVAESSGTAQPGSKSTAEDGTKSTLPEPSMPPPPATTAAPTAAPTTEEPPPPPPPETAAPPPSKTAPPKPPKTAKPPKPPSTKPPSGGIVRETPF